MSENVGSFRPVCQFCFDLTPVAAAAVGVGSQLLIAPKTLVEAVAPVVPIRRFSVPDSCSSVSKKTSYFCEKNYCSFLLQQIGACRSIVLALKLF